MRINTRDIPAIEEIEIDRSPTEGQEPEVWANVSYAALSRLEQLVAKGNRRSVLAIGISLGIGGVMVAMMLANLSKSSQSFIARSNGQVETLEFYSGNERSDALIQSFAGRFTQNLYTWRSTLPEPGNPLDKGIEEGSKVIPSGVYKATLGMNPQFALAFRKGIADLISHNLKDTDFQAVFIPKIVETPKKAGSGIWRIRVVGYQQILGKEKATKVIAIELTVKAVPPPTIRASDKQQQNSLALASAAARAEGLEVINLVNVKE